MPYRLRILLAGFVAAMLPIAASCDESGDGGSGSDTSETTVPLSPPPSEGSGETPGSAEDGGPPPSQIDDPFGLYEPIIDSPWQSPGGSEPPPDDDPLVLTELSSSSDIAAVPEPVTTTLLMLAGGGLALAATRRRRKRIR